MVNTCYRHTPRKKRKAIPLLRALPGKAAIGGCDLRSYAAQHRAASSLLNRNSCAGAGAQGIAGTRDDNWRLAGRHGCAGTTRNGRASHSVGYSSDEREVGEPLPTEQSKFMRLLIDRVKLHEDVLDIIWQEDSWQRFCRELEHHQFVVEQRVPADEETV